MNPQAYMTFPDGGLGYNCNGCGNCCKGLGIGFDSRTEMQHLMASWPELAAFTRNRGEAWTAFNPRDRCWFLDDRGLCRIEGRDGRAMKPAACRLFPFNRVFRLGSWTIVDYNAVICPLNPVPDGVTGVTHASVLEEMASVADPALVASPIEFEGGSRAASDWLERERRVAAAAFGPDPSWRGVLDAQVHEVASGDEVVFEVRNAFDAVLGRRPAPPDPLTLRNALLATPSLRFNEEFGPRRWHRGPAWPEALARTWLAFLFMMADGVSLAGRPLTLQELTSSWGDAMALAWVLAHWFQRPLLGPGPVPLSGPVAERAGIVAAARRCVDNRKLTLGDVVSPLINGAPRHVAAARIRLLEPLFGRMRFVRERQPFT